MQTVGKAKTAQRDPALHSTNRRLFRLRAGVVVALVLIAIAAGDWLVWRSVKQADLRDEALRLSAEGNFAAAESPLLDASERNHHDAEVTRALALGYLSADKPIHADKYLSRWCELQPAEIEPHERRLDFCLAEKQHDQAIIEGKRLLELSPNHPRARQVMANLLLQQGSFAEAEAACRRFLQGDSRQAGLLYCLASACHGQGKLEEAGSILESLIEQQPKHCDALVLRAILFCEAEQCDKAIPLLRRALAQDPSHPQAHSHLIQALARTGQTEEARREREQLLREATAGQLMADIRVQPDNLELALQAAEAMLNLGRKSEGDRLLDSILARAPGNEAALRLRAASRRGAAGSEKR